MEDNEVRKGFVRIVAHGVYALGAALVRFGLAVFKQKVEGSRPPRKKGEQDGKHSRD